MMYLSIRFFFLLNANGFIIRVNDNTKGDTVSYSGISLVASTMPLVALKSHRLNLDQSIDR